MIQKQVLYSLIIIVNLGVFFAHSSFLDKLDELGETISKKGAEFIEKEVAREKKRRHNQAVRVLTKISNKYKDDFECLNEATDFAKRRCFTSIPRKNMEDELVVHIDKYRKDIACYFEQIKEHREKTESAEFDLDEHEKIDSELNAQLINENMNKLQATYKRVFDNEIRAGSNKE